MAKIFISYRRQDAQWQTRALYAAVSRHVANPGEDIFYDLDSMTVGLNFKRQIEETVQQCDVLLAVIGRDWLTLTDEAGNRRLDDPNDFVRLEIAAALARDIRVVPVLLDGTEVPPASALPDDLKELSERHGVKIRAESFDADAHVLVKGLGLIARPQDYGEEDWHLIDASLKVEDYDAFRERHRDHARSFEAARRIRQLTQYAALDLTSARALADFRKEKGETDPLFPALQEQSKREMERAARTAREAPPPAAAAPATDTPPAPRPRTGLYAALAALLVAGLGIGAWYGGLLSGEGSPTPPEDAAPEFDAAEAARRGDAAYEAEDYATALTEYDTACNGADMSGCFGLGLLYRNGYGVPQDYDRARSLYSHACDGGNMRGCSNLGVLYQHALGVTQDYDRARSLYEQACEGGEMRGCSNLGVLYRNGQGVPQDYDRARTLYEQACNGGNMPSCGSLGYLYHKALGVPQDYALARSLYEQACEGGEMGGCNNLGVLYDNGYGVPHDYDRARSLFEQACEGGNERACTNLSRLPE